MRVGQGIDVHPFSDDLSRPLVLGGVRIAETGGLAGHSDADAVAHALADAVLGAAGLGDLGDHFPDTDPAWAGADSVELLRVVVDKARAAGFRPVNADCTVMLEAPKLAPHRAAMVARMSDALGAPVGVKATRPEGLTPAVLCIAVVLLEPTGG
ncbi:MAG TPA: 2-C-methyl-D-erythritol 2,4-cyclodiphosphate synthase [Acidimicrobiales bacterium]|nr:2-C-methyl-D-erythritol 2,4-cyclodiphosphate synthase [Acidimicrobiales bacterium]